MKKLLLLLVAVIFIGCGSDDRVTANGNVFQGSSNKFSISEDYLYILNETSLLPYNVTTPSSPKEEATIHVDIGIETVITKGDNLFIGAQDGMYIFDISDRANPRYLSTYRHITGCDPVVVQDDIAYVTLRTGIGCRGSINSLDVVDISDLRNPFATKTINMYNPHGLGVEGDHLIVTEGDQGLVKFSIATPASPQRIYTDSQYNSQDVIMVNNANYDHLLIVTGDDGIFQYNYSGTSLTFLSKITF